jgi:hypothetical protein
LTNAVQLKVFSTGITGVGSLEEFVSNARHTKPINSTGILIPWITSIGSGVYAGGVKIVGNQTSGVAKLYWTENTITYDNHLTGDAHKVIELNA